MKASMKLTLMIGAIAGYLLGARAGRERYESIVRIARRAVAGSPQTQCSRPVSALRRGQRPVDSLRGTPSDGCSRTTRRLLG